ncbi:MAG: hypothetical protein EBY81_05630, partial [Verrucomicrobia bacterium]|nr:hypothetical protein [Verrucomicrobiota bacterium]
LGQIFHILMYDDCNQPQCNEIFEKLQLVTLYRTINEYLALYGHTDITDTRLSMYNAFEEIVKSSIKATSTAYGNSAAKILSTAKQLASENLVKYKIVADILNLAQMSTADTPEHDIASIYLDYLIEPFRENSMFTELTLRGKDLEFVKGLLGYVKIIVANDDCKGMIEILIDYTLRNCFEYQDWCDRLASVSSDFSNGLMFATHEEFMRKCRSCLSGEDYRNLQDSRECITSHQAKILFSIVQLANSSKTPDTIGKVIALLSNPGFGKTQLVLYVIIHLALMGHKIGLSTTNTIDYDNYRRDIKVDKPEVSKSEVDKPKVSKSTALTASANMYDALFIQENPRPRPSLRPNGGGGSSGSSGLFTTKCATTKCATTATSNMPETIMNSTNISRGTYSLNSTYQVFTGFMENIEYMKACGHFKVLLERILDNIQIFGEHDVSLVHEFVKKAPESEKYCIFMFDEVATVGNRSTTSRNLLIFIQHGILVITTGATGGTAKIMKSAACDEGILLVNEKADEILNSKDMIAYMCAFTQCMDTSKTVENTEDLEH